MSYVRRDKIFVTVVPKNVLKVFALHALIARLVFHYHVGYLGFTRRKKNRSAVVFAAYIVI